MSVEQASSRVADGERKTVTALFADLKGSTELMESLDPEEARAIVDPALGIMVEAVSRYVGYVVQSTGDGIFALFGAPAAYEDHPQRSIYAALQMRHELREYAQRLATQGRPPVEFRIGIHTGEVVVRTVETGGKVEYTPIGHTANLASRLETVAPAGSIAVSEHTRSLVEGYFDLRALGPLPIRGINQPINVYEVTGLGPLRTHFQLSIQRGLTKFVGRGRELAEMQRALVLAMSGRGQIVAVVAEAGAGKSRLLYEFKARLQSECKVLEAYSVSHGKASAWLPVLELLRGYFGIQQADDSATRREKIKAAIAALDPGALDTASYLFSLFAIAESPDPLALMDPQVKLKRTMELLKRILVRESLKQPLVVIFEDLHWIDGQTQALLDFLVDGIANARILLLVNYRPEYFHEWGSKSFYTQLRLDPLGHETTQEVLGALLGEAIELEALKRLIAEKTGGNPFFIEEMVQALFDQGVLIRNGTVKIARPLSQLRLPLTVQALLASRIDRLLPAHKELLQTLAVIGQQLSLALIRKIASPTDGKLDEILSALQAGEFIYEQPTDVGVEYVFKHSLTREVAYNGLLIERRKQLHGQTGDALEMVFADRLDDKLDELAHHYRHSGNTPKAIEYLRRAADQNRERAAYPIAVEQLETALELVQSLPPAHRAYSELIIRLGMHTALRGTKGYAEASLVRNARRARELSIQLGPNAELESFGGPRDQFRTASSLNPVELTLRMLWSLTFNGGRMEEARSLLSELWAGVRQTRARASTRYAHWASGFTHMWMGEFVPARRHFERSALGNTWSEYVQQIGVEASYVFSHLSHLLWLLGYPEQGMRLAEEAVELAPTTHQNLAVAGAADAELKMLSECLRDQRGSRSKAQTLLTLTRDSRLAYFLEFANLRMGSVLMLEGDTEQGLPLLRHSVKSFRESGEAFALMVALFALAYGCFIASRVDDGMMVLDQALAEMESRGRRVYEAEFHRLRGEFLLMQNASNKSAAESCFREAMKIARRQQAKSWELRATTSFARLLADQGKRDDARRMLAEIYNWFTEGFETADLREAAALLAELGQN